MRSWVRRSAGSRPLLQSGPPQFGTALRAHAANRALPAHREALRPGPADRGDDGPRGGAERGRVPAAGRRDLRLDAVPRGRRLRRGLALRSDLREPARARGGGEAAARRPPTGRGQSRRGEAPAGLGAGGGCATASPSPPAASPTRSSSSLRGSTRFSGSSSGLVRVDDGTCRLSPRGEAVYARLVDAGRVELAALVPKQDGDGAAAPVIRRLAESLVAGMPEQS